MLIVAPDAKFVPVIETDVPPAVVPVLGEMFEIAGGLIDPPPDLGMIVVSFLSAPGEVLR
jgi:hypothetical protein